MLLIGCTTGCARILLIGCTRGCVFNLFVEPTCALNGSVSAVWHRRLDCTEEEPHSSTNESRWTGPCCHDVGQGGFVALRHQGAGLH